MRTGSVLIRLTAAALAALAVWAAVTVWIGNHAGEPARLLGVEETPETGETDRQDVLYDLAGEAAEDEDQTVFEPLPAATPAPQMSEGVFEFAVTEEYFAYLLSRDADALPLKNGTVSVSAQSVTVSGDVQVAVFAERMGIPSAVFTFLPETVPCTLVCVPEVCDGKLHIKIGSVSCRSELLAPYLERADAAAAVERFVNEIPERYLPDGYRPESVTLTDGGLWIRYRNPA